MNEELMSQLDNITLMKFAIQFLIVAVGVFLYMQVMKRRSLFSSKILSQTVGRAKNRTGKESYVKNSLELISNLAKIIQRTPFAIFGANEEYLQYNLTRALVKVPGKQRIMSAVEFNAIRITYMALFIIIGILLLFVNVLIGFCVILSTIVFGNIMPMQILRAKVSTNDRIISENFPDCYFMLHYILLTGAKTPLDKLLKSYSTQVESEVFKQFLDVWIGYIETYSEQEATKYMVKEYREINSVCKLMRIIKQLFNGDDVNNDLLGFKNELTLQKKYILNKAMDKTIAKANFSFNIIMIILIQAILSAMSIYLPDLGSISSFI